MAAKDLVHRLIGDSSSLENASDRGGRALSKMEREARRLERQQRRTHNAMTELGQGMLVAGAAVAAGLALSVKAAIEWESAWAGVLKTVDGSPEQMAALEKEIRGLAATLPATHQEIAAVAEAAGQLGIQRENVASFTRVMIDMGEATNLSATEAATALARFMNIMQTAPDEVSNLGSAIVDLGNNSATTESEIVAMALRIAGAGQAIGLTESEVLSFSAALSSVGIRAQAGGTAISRVFVDIDKAVRESGDQLTTFAEVAGMSVDEFQRAYEQDAAGAINTFVQGLGRIQQSGGDVNAVLSELGFTEVRVADALRRLAGSGDLLTRSLETGSSAWEENTALAEEAERRYGTTAARIEIARNQVTDFAIDVGSSLLPVLGSLADTLGAVAGMFGNLPGPVKAAVGILAALVAGLLLAGGTALIAVPKLAAFKAALDQVALSGGRAAAAVGVFRGAAGAVTGFLFGPWGAALAAGVAAVGLFANEQGKAAREVTRLSQELQLQGNRFTENNRLIVANELATKKWREEGERSAEIDLVSMLNQLDISLSTATDAALGHAGAMSELNTRLAEAEAAYERTTDANGRAKEGQEAARQEAIENLFAIREIIDAVADQNGVIDEAAAKQLLMAEASGQATGELAGLDPATRQVAEGFDLTASEAQNLADSVDALDKELKGLFDVLFGVEEAEDAAAQAMRRLTEAAQENGAKLRGNSEAALDNRSNVRDLIAADQDLIVEMHNAGAGADELTEKTEKLKQKFIEQMLQAGFSEEAVEEYAAAYDEIPSIIETLVETPGMTQAEQNARNLKLAIDRIPTSVNVNVNFSTPHSLPSPGPGGEIAFQHGGEVRGPGGVDNVRIRATAGEFMIRREVAQENMAALRAFNRTGRFPVAAIGGGVSAAPAAGTDGGAMLEGALYLDSGEFLGKVRGVVRQGISEHNRDVKQAVLAGAGRAR